SRNPGHRAHARLAVHPAGGPGSHGDAPHVRTDGFTALLHPRHPSGRHGHAAAENGPPLAVHAQVLHQPARVQPEPVIVSAPGASLASSRRRPTITPVTHLRATIGAVVILGLSCHVMMA